MTVDIRLGVLFFSAYRCTRLSSFCFRARWSLDASQCGPWFAPKCDQWFTSMAWATVLSQCGGPFDSADISLTHTAHLERIALRWSYTSFLETGPMLCVKIYMFWYPINCNPCPACFTTLRLPDTFPFYGYTCYALSAADPASWMLEVFNRGDWGSLC